MLTPDYLILQVLFHHSIQQQQALQEHSIHTQHTQGLMQV